MTDRIEALSTGGKQVSDTSKEAVERLADEFEAGANLSCFLSNAKYREAADTIRALQAEVEALREQAVTVKPLEWEDTSRSFSGERLSAQTIFGVEYVCLWDDRSISWSVFIWGEWKDCGDAGGLEKAKAAAQADYERRILSAIDTVPAAQVRKEALEDAAREMESWGDDSPQTGVFMAGEIRALAEKEGE